MTEEKDVDARIADGGKDDLVSLLEDESIVATLTPDQQLALAQHRSVDVPRALAKHGATLTEETQRVLAKSRIFTARRELVKSAGANLPSDLLDALAEDEDGAVRNLVAKVRDPEGAKSEGLSVRKGQLMVLDAWWDDERSFSFKIPVRNGWLVEEAVTSSECSVLAAAFVIEGVELGDGPIDARFIGQAELESGLFAIVDEDNRDPFSAWKQSKETEFGWGWGGGDGFVVMPRGTDVHSTPARVFALSRQGATIGFVVPLLDWEADPSGLEMFALDLRGSDVLESVLEMGAGGSGDVAGYEALGRWLDFAVRVSPGYANEMRVQVDDVLERYTSESGGNLIEAFGGGSLETALGIVKHLAAKGSAFATDKAGLLEAEFGPRVKRVARLQVIEEEVRARAEQDGRLELRKAEQIALVEAAIAIALEDGLSERDAINEVASEFGIKPLTVQTIYKKMRKER